MGNLVIFTGLYDGSVLLSFSRLCDGCHQERGFPGTNSHPSSGSASVHVNMAPIVWLLL